MPRISRPKKKVPPKRGASSASRSSARAPQTPAEMIPPVSAAAPEAEEWLAPNLGSIAQAQLFAKQVDANMRLLRYRQLTGDLIEKDLVLTLAGDISRQQREALYNWIDIASPELAAITDPKQVRTYLREKFPLLFDDLEALWFPKTT